MSKLVLNEDLFEPFELFGPDNSVEEIADVEIPSANAEIGVVEEETPGGPNTGAETGIANQLIEMINGEWNTIADYNNLIAMLTQYGFEEFIPVIEDINNEENLHVGQLQALLQKISPNTSSIQQGELEASSEQMNESVNGKKFSFGLITNDYPVPRICNAILINETDDSYTFETSLYKFTIDKDKFNDCLRDGKSIRENDCITFEYKESLNEEYEQIDFNDFRSKLNGKEIEMLERFYDESDAFIYYDNKLDRYLIKDTSDEYGPYTLDELINDISYTIAEWDKLDN